MGCAQLNKVGLEHIEDFLHRGELVGGEVVFYHCGYDDCVQVNDWPLAQGIANFVEQLLIALSLTDCSIKIAARQEQTESPLRCFSGLDAVRRRKKIILRNLNT